MSAPVIEGLETTMFELDVIGVTFVRLHGYMPTVSISFMDGVKVCVVRGYGRDYAQAFSEARLSLLNERARLASGRV